MLCNLYTVRYCLLKRFPSCDELWCVQTRIQTQGCVSPPGSCNPYRPIICGQGFPHPAATHTHPCIYVAVGRGTPSRRGLVHTDESFRTVSHMWVCILFQTLLSLSLVLSFQQLNSYSMYTVSDGACLPSWTISWDLRSSQELNIICRSLMISGAALGAPYIKKIWPPLVSVLGVGTHMVLWLRVEWWNVETSWWYLFWLVVWINKYHIKYSSVFLKVCL